MRANRSEEGLCRRLRVSCVSNVVKCLLTLVHVFTWDNSGIVPTSSNWTSASGTSSAGRLALSKPSTRRMKRTRSNAGRARCALRSGSSRSSRFCPNDGATGHNHGLLGPDASAKKNTYPSAAPDFLCCAHSEAHQRNVQLQKDAGQRASTAHVPCLFLS